MDSMRICFWNARLLYPKKMGYALRKSSVVVIVQSAVVMTNSLRKVLT